MDISFVDLLAGNLYVSRLRRDNNIQYALEYNKKRGKIPTHKYFYSMHARKFHKQIMPTSNYPNTL